MKKLSLPLLVTLSTLASCGQPLQMQNLQTPGLKATQPKLSAKWITKNGPPKIQGELVVQFRQGFNTKQVAPPPQLGGRFSQTLNVKGQKFGLLKLQNKSDSSMAQTLAAMRSNPAYASVEYNPRYHALYTAPRYQPRVTRFSTTPQTQPQTLTPASGLALNDAFFPLQWALPKIGVPYAWEQTQGSQDILVAVVDSGIDYNHPDLKGQIVNGLDFMAEIPTGPNGEGSPDVVDEDPMDQMGHGTHVAGIINALPNNRTGIAGIAPNVKVLNIKALSAEGWGSAFAIAQGITYAVDKGARVINLSLGSGQGSKPIELAVQYAIEKGAVVVAAAGNDYTHTGFPASYPGVIAVGATDKDDFLADFSNHDKRINVMAPGVDIMSTTPTFLTNTMSQNGVDQFYSVMSGTSMACPMVTAQAALILSKNPTLNALQVKEIIEKSAKNIGDRRIFGAGRIQVTEALNQVPAMAPPPSAAPPNSGVSAQRFR